MAKIVQHTRDGDKLTMESNDPKVIEQAENAPFNDSSNIAHTQVIEGR